ncbi:10503_t:CDS:1, partial [Dentiscutata heterogama]
MIKQFYKDDRIHNDYESAFEDFMREHEIATNNHNRNQVELQYPPLAHSTPVNDPPPAYDTAYGEESHLHGLRHNASYEAYKAGRQFTRDNPPHEILPPREHIVYILSNGGAKAWKMVIYANDAPGSTSMFKDMASISDDGRTVTFHGKNDAMVQANYPLFRPQLDNDDDSLQPHSNIINSATSNNISSSNLPPDYEQ